METGPTSPVDIFPWLKYLPEWMFGNYVTRAKGTGMQMQTLYEEILNAVIKRRKGGQNLGSFIDRLLDTEEKHNLPWGQSYFVGGVLMEGDSDTSYSLTIAIVQALTIWPEIQRKAHAEIDAVVIHERSPTWDFKNLPYINMIIKEGHRWRPILPPCFPYSLGQDDGVDGKFLPKGTTVIVNTSGMHLDLSQPYDLAAFIPERYSSHSSLVPEYAAGKWEEKDHYGYGVGRIICPGIHLAERNMFLTVAKLLWAFEFERKEGKIHPDPVTGYHHGLLYCTRDYGVRPVLRNKTFRSTLEREFAEAQKVFSIFQTAY